SPATAPPSTSSTRATSGCANGCWIPACCGVPLAATMLTAVLSPQSGWPNGATSSGSASCSAPLACRSSPAGPYQLEPTTGAGLTGKLALLATSATVPESSLCSAATPPGEPSPRFWKLMPLLLSVTRLQRSVTLLLPLYTSRPWVAPDTVLPLTSTP